MQLSLWDAYGIGWYITSLCNWAQGVEVRMSEMSDKLNNISVQLGKAHDDIVAKIDELTRALESAQAEDPDVAQALTNLQTAADSITAIVPPAETVGDAQ